jgi:hypothetical protein
MHKASSPQYLAKVKSLSKDETERLEDEQLDEWRKMMHALKKKDVVKAAPAKTQAAGKAKVSAQPEAKGKNQASAKPKAGPAK